MQAMDSESRSVLSRWGEDTGGKRLERDVRKSVSDMFIIFKNFIFLFFYLRERESTQARAGGKEQIGREKQSPY